MIDNASVRALLAAVRRRLLRDRLARAARWAAWAAAGCSLLGAALHVAVQPLAHGALVAGLAACWTAALAWAASRRATDPECALWADRHLGGASAFTTLLDIAARPRAGSDDRAARWLLQWATARVPHALTQLGARGHAPRLSRPLAAMGICWALAALALALPGRSSSGPSLAAPAPAAGPSAAVLPLAETPGEQAQRVTALARAARGEPSADAAALRSAIEGDSDRGRRGPAPTPPKTGQAFEPAGAAPTGAESAGGLHSTPQRPEASRSRTGPSGTEGATGATAAASGRAPGDSPDVRAAVGVSRPWQGPLDVRRSPAPGRGSSERFQADAGESAAYADGGAGPTGAAGRFEPAAATPPPAAPSNRLGAAEASYVQAWTTAHTHNR